MNHDELLILLKDYAGAAGLRMDRNSWLILADVVELHKPGMITAGLPVCSICRGPGLQHGMERDLEIYPCATMQAIKKGVE
tara:strand:+ start:680 stop:922 length:243 start_codon:yes stop_codon:yes gene_type:complete